MGLVVREDLLRESALRVAVARCALACARLSLAGCDGASVGAVWECGCFAYEAQDLACALEIQLRRAPALLLLQALELCVCEDDDAGSELLDRVPVRQLRDRAFRVAAPALAFLVRVAAERREGHGEARDRVAALVA